MGQPGPSQFWTGLTLGFSIWARTESKMSVQLIFGPGLNCDRKSEAWPDLLAQLLKQVVLVV